MNSSDVINDSLNETKSSLGSVNDSYDESIFQQTIDGIVDESLTSNRYSISDSNDVNSPKISTISAKSSSVSRHNNLTPTVTDKNCSFISSDEDAEFDRIKSSTTSNRRRIRKIASDSEDEVEEELYSPTKDNSYRQKKYFDSDEEEDKDIGSESSDDEDVEEQGLIRVNRNEKNPEKYVSPSSDNSDYTEDQFQLDSNESDDNSKEEQDPFNSSQKSPKKSTGILYDKDNSLQKKYLDSNKEGNEEIENDYSADENIEAQDPMQIEVNDPNGEESNDYFSLSSDRVENIEEQKQNPNESYRNKSSDIVSCSSSSDESDYENQVVELSSDDGTPLKCINLEEKQNRGKNVLRQTTLDNMVKNISINENRNHIDDTKYSSAVEYANQAKKVANLRTDALKCKNTLRTVNMNLLPDKGALLQQRQNNLEQQLIVEEEILKKMVVNKSDTGEKKISWDQLVANSSCVVPKTFGKQALNTHTVQKSLTMDRLKNLHDSLATCPSEETYAEDPKGLKVELMPHQKRALTWLMWREGQKPAGGILADDMGLGKTLTMISLILQTKEMEIENSNSDSDKEEKDNDWKTKHSKCKVSGGTLVICPATLIGQWEGEILRRLKRNLLTVELYHGTKRETRAARLAKYDVVITTFKLAQGEYVKKGPLFNIKWKRIILDEAHIVRNHKSQTSLAVCGLTSKTRWALTGTPVHNKELDLYALLKFLRCSPFDDLGIWKHWVANKNAGGQDRLNTVMTTILLRRTKEQLQSEGGLKGLPKRIFELIQVELDDAEKQVYQKVLIFSRSLFIEFLRQRESKNPDLVYAKGGGFTETNNEQYNKMHKKVLQMHGSAEVKSHEILVLLLRLRQICCHPSLIVSMLDQENCEAEGIEEDGLDIDIFHKLDNLNLEDDNSVADTINLNEPEDFSKAANKLLSTSNPVFAPDRSNEKLRTIRKIIEEKVIPNGDKIIIVSQWTSMLQLILGYLKQSKIKCDILDGKVPVNKRNDMVVNFNDPKEPIKVLLLSLTAGGVGLNLVGANHLLLVDLHWNPQLESQAQDRIYRVGQNKPVYIYKIVTTDTIEERIKALQDSKLSMATNILAGTRDGAGSKLSMNDLKMLFNV